MTTLAVIGGGIAGRSLIYALAKQKKTFSKILLFDADTFAHTCSLRSTAIVAPRGVSAGLSNLGDLLLEGFRTFSAHVQQDTPAGVFQIPQYTSAVTRLEQFKQRYPASVLTKTLPEFSLKEELLVATEEAFLIDTKAYLDWLLKDSPVSVVTEFVTGVEENTVRTVNGSEHLFDHLVFAGGSANQYWDFKTPAKRVQGSYLEFREVDFGAQSFSATLEGENLIYQAHSKLLLIGSTSRETLHEWPQLKQLEQIYASLAAKVELRLPEFEQGRVITGLREKAPKRTPYLVTEGKFSRVGGFYKNGFSLGLMLGQRLAAELRS